MQTSLFISKHLNEIPLLVDYCFKHSIQLKAHSFLKFEAIPFDVPENFDILFFSSPRSVDFFLTYSQIPKNVLIACAGETTQKALIYRGLETSFIPTESGTVGKSQLEFKDWVGERSVFFPVSNLSKRSYAKVLSENQVIEIPTYKTHITPTKINPASIYVFTSPSNVVGFFEASEIAENAHLIAWGETTKTALENYTNKGVLCLEKSEEAVLVGKLNSILGV
jgi:uroporphyrinogen-III synthase